ncbi:hypothetical protein P153DRAFT_68593 [Dothidotthia symphoricarpi CBS 119687]|uniref:Uncharacterized protein n=1 Tax=Dothidotthia symphoricarpi CBS 119687 TaxID=1392245 RepID=A0A6A6A6A7_9PLEO|nr:uncharacterized protein P153DRAFT_68593 [Dothidotthia symphoricarpi CBS 119687]KAF2126715.1 hypothetical protein P153DRAFT_68593 [Dothidotthia symphoricarpi CBS 119687]
MHNCLIHFLHPIRYEFTTADTHPFHSRNTKSTIFKHAANHTHHHQGTTCAQMQHGSPVSRACTAKPQIGPPPAR